MSLSIPQIPVSSESAELALQSIQRLIPRGRTIVSLAPGFEEALAECGSELVTLSSGMPADKAVEAINAATAAGAQYLLVPGTALSWLEAQDELYEYLATNARELTWRAEAAGLFHLAAPPADVTELQCIRVSRRISTNDVMYASGPDAYFNFGRAGLRCVRDALRLTEAGHHPSSLLDLPSGHGRVLRFLKAWWPDSEIVACDLDHDAVDYCAVVLGATPVYSHVQVDRIPLDHTFDAIWVGSLLTHLDAHLWEEFLTFFCERLSPGGVLVCTFHGEYIAERVRIGELNYSIPDTTGLLQEWEARGFAYQNYVHQPGYGISLSHSDWVRTQVARVARARLLDVWPRGWFGRQDVAVIAAVPPLAPPAGAPDAAPPGAPASTPRAQPAAARGTDSTRPRICAMTMVYNEAPNLPRWLSYYSRQVGVANCVVVDHGSDDGSLELLPDAVGRLSLPRSGALNEHTRAAFITSLANSFLMYFDAVLYTDVDEYLVPDPRRFASLPDFFLQNRESHYFTAFGLNVHHCQGEAPLSASMPIMRQRNYLSFRYEFCKTLLAADRIRWFGGFHSSNVAPAFHGLYLLHTKRADRGLLLRRAAVTRGIEMAPEHAELVNPHWRFKDSETLKREDLYCSLPICHWSDEIEMRLQEDILSRVNREVRGDDDAYVIDSTPGWATEVRFTLPNTFDDVV